MNVHQTIPATRVYSIIYNIVQNTGIDFLFVSSALYFIVQKYSVENNFSVMNLT